MNHYTLFCHGFDEQQITSMTAILNLAELALAESWRIIPQDTADVVMINMDNEESNQSYAAYLQTFPSYRIILVSENVTVDQEDIWFLSKKPHAPPSLRELVNLLNQVALCLIEEVKKADSADSIEKQAQLEESEKPVKPTHEIQEEKKADSIEKQAQLEEPEKPVKFTHEIQKEKNVVDIEEDENHNSQIKTSENRAVRKEPLSKSGYLFSLVQQVQKDNYYCIITLNELPAVYLLPAEKHFYFSGSTGDLITYCVADQRSLTKLEVTRAKIKKSIKNDAVGNYYSLTELISFAVIKASQGRLLEGYSETEALRLKQIPNGAQIPSLHKYHEISEFMIDQEIDLLSVSEQLHIPLAELFEFINACSILGYIEQVTKDDGDTQQETSNKKTLSRFFASFFK